MDTLKEAVKRQGQIVSRSTLAADPEIYTRDWEKKHKKALKRLAVALLELRDAHEAELEVARDAMKAGCFPNGGGSFCEFAMRPSIRLLNGGTRTLLQSLRGSRQRPICFDTRTAAASPWPRRLFPSHFIQKERK